MRPLRLSEVAAAAEAIRRTSHVCGAEAGVERDALGPAGVDKASAGQTERRGVKLKTKFVIGWFRVAVRVDEGAQAGNVSEAFAQLLCIGGTLAVAGV